MMENSVGSRSMKIALCSSRRLEMRPLRRAVKKVSGIHVSVCLDVEKLQWEKIVEHEDKKLKHGNSSPVPSDCCLLSFVYAYESSKLALLFSSSCFLLTVDRPH